MLRWQVNITLPDLNRTNSRPVAMAFINTVNDIHNREGTISMHTLRKDTASKTHFWIAVIQVLVLALLALALKPAEAQTDPRTGTQAAQSGQFLPL